MVNTEDIRRRIRAARALGGLSSAAALADRINQRGLSDKTLRKIESGERPNVEERELRAIADACGVPYSFFTFDPEILVLFDDEWPNQGMLEAAGLGEASQIEIVRLALALLNDALVTAANLPTDSDREVTVSLESAETPLGVAIRTSGASPVEYLAIQQAVEPLLQGMRDDIARGLMDDLKAVLANLMTEDDARRSAGDRLERELERVARQREQQAHSSGSGSDDPPERAPASEGPGQSRS